MLIHLIQPFPLNPRNIFLYCRPTNFKSMRGRYLPTTKPIHIYILGYFRETKESGAKEVKRE